MSSARHYWLAIVGALLMASGGARGLAAIPAAVAAGRAISAPSAATAAVGAAGPLARIKGRYGQLRREVASRPRLHRDAYVAMGMFVARRFIHFLEQGQESRRWQRLQVRELRRVLARLGRRIKTLRDRQVQPYVFPKPQPPISVRQGLLWSGPRGKRRPVFLYGYLNGDQAFHALGVSLLQEERGPTGMAPDGRLTARGRSMVEALSAAWRAGVMVDMQLSPHYFPTWAVRKAPHVLLARRRWGFIHFNIDHPEARLVIRQWVHAIVPAVRRQPALMSICLANEPKYFSSGLDRYSRPAWTRYLKRIHGSIANLNRLYQTHYQRFDQVPVPSLRYPYFAAGGPPKRHGQAPTPGAAVAAGNGPCRAYFDWCRFNQRHLAGWLRWINRMVKRQDPGVLTDVKVFNSVFVRRAVDNGVAPGQICAITDLAGCDSWALPASRGRWGFHWRGQEIWYELLHSFRGQPVFNSEDHLLRDNIPAVWVNPAATRAALWLGALHHLAAATIWGSAFYVRGQAKTFRGDIYVRPANTYALSRAMLDINRLAPYVAAIDQAPAQVALLYSFPSLFWNPRYRRVVKDAYTALDLSGHNVTFISERQLARGERSAANAKVKWILLAGATHVTNAAVAGLQRFVAQGGHVWAVGPRTLAFDQYNQRRQLPASLARMPQFSEATGSHALAQALDARLARQGLGTTWLRNPANGRIIWGLEYRFVRTGGRTLVPLMDLENRPRTVRIDLPGPCRDLVSGQAIDPRSVRLQPLAPLLLAFGRHSSHRR